MDGLHPGRIVTGFLENFELENFDSDDHLKINNFSFFTTTAVYLYVELAELSY